VILIVSQDSEVCTAVKTALEATGNRVLALSSPSEALEKVGENEPELILSELDFADMTGLAFRQEYFNRFPDRRTLICFLADHSGLDKAVASIEDVADDFVVKPIDPTTLASRVRMLLKRNTQGIRARFRGDIKQMPLMEVLGFCERHKLTGRVKFETPKGAVDVSFNAGEIELDDPDKLDNLADISTGTFIIESLPVGFNEIEQARHMTSMPPRVPQPPQPPQVPQVDVPIGRLSAVRVGGREFKLQTEYEPPPSCKVISIVILDGNVVRQQSADPPAGANVDQLWAFLDDQHLRIEQMVREKIGGFFHEQSTRQMKAIEPAPASKPSPQPGPAAAPDKTTLVIQEPARGRRRSSPRNRMLEDSDPPLQAAAVSSGPPPADDKDSLFDMGLRKWREKDLASALVLLEAAHNVDPTDHALVACVRAVRRKLKRGA
jgi:DNA-binding response OmpR family regulator